MDSGTQPSLGERGDSHVVSLKAASLSLPQQVLSRVSTSPQLPRLTHPYLPSPPSKEGEGSVVPTWQRVSECKRIMGATTACTEAA